jgi:hypothetical protein
VPTKDETRLVTTFRTSIGSIFQPCYGGYGPTIRSLSQRVPRVGAILNMPNNSESEAHTMRTIPGSIPLLLVLAVSLVTVSMASAAAIEPCKVLSAEAWGSSMGYSVTATPGDMTCTYQGKAGGGQFRIMSETGSSADATAAVKRMREHQSHQPKGGHDPRLNVIDSQGGVVFSIALFQDSATDASSSQLQKLAASAKQHLPR